MKREVSEEMDEDGSIKARPAFHQLLTNGLILPDMADSLTLGLVPLLYRPVRMMDSLSMAGQDLFPSSFDRHFKCLFFCCCCSCFA